MSLFDNVKKYFLFIHVLRDILGADSGSYGESAAPEFKVPRMGDIFITSAVVRKVSNMDLPTCLYPDPGQSILRPRTTSWTYILISSQHLHLRLASGILPSVFPTKTMSVTLHSPIRATCPAHLIILDHPNNVQ